MIKKDLKLSYNDVSIVPAVETFISSRSECSPIYSNGNLPIFTAPMSCVIDDKTYTRFDDNNINVVIPRTVSFKKRLELCDRFFIALSLDEAELLLSDKYIGDDKYVYICIDVANGHMSNIFNIIRELRSLYGSRMVIMSGNIANPNTYIQYNNSGCDFVRVGIGGGSGCLSSSNTGVHYPYASLISETYEVKTATNGTCKIIADGGIKGYNDVVKALALGADYVMIGGLFAQCIDSAGEFLIDGLKTYDIESHKNDYKKINMEKVFYGMSTKRAQIEMGKKELKTSEGKEVRLKVNTDISSWVDNMKSYLQSAMSYTNKRNLYDFIGKVDLIMLSNNASNSFNK